jgi:hypothetical protein|tara:strand:- start:371 stop:694 length:324 start_codon:yes stop_codon:yes gene_type:complete
MTSYRKYRNIPTEVDGIRFASKKEANRYSELKLLVLAGRISKLEIHPQIALMVNGMKIGKYTADFRYRENGESVLEDVKSKATKTRDYILRKKILSTYTPPIFIRET